MAAPYVPLPVVDDGDCNGEAVTRVRQIERTIGVLSDVVRYGVQRGAHLAVVGQGAAPVPTLGEARQAADVLTRLALHLRTRLTADQIAELDYRPTDEHPF